MNGLPDDRLAVLAESLAKSYPAPDGELVVLRDVSLTLRPGQAVAIMGPSGSGKSTLLNLLGGLDTPTGGRLRVAGLDPFQLGPRELARFRNRTVGFIFQEHHLLPQLTVLENVLLPTLADRPAADALPRALRLLDRVGLSHRRDHRPAELSGGERQRVAIARALIMGPALLLADEPTGNLDRSTAQAVGELLAEIQAREGVALVVVTHSERLARRFPHAFEMNDGRLVPL